MIQTDFINFVKHAVLPKRAWQGHNTSVGRVDLLVIITGTFNFYVYITLYHICIYNQHQLCWLSVKYEYELIIQVFNKI